MDDMVTSEFSDGVDAYWSGQCPDGWDDFSIRCKSPFLTGWWMASMWETQPGYLTDSDGESLNPDE